MATWANGIRRILLGPGIPLTLMATLKSSNMAMLNSEKITAPKDKPTNIYKYIYIFRRDKEIQNLTMAPFFKKIIYLDS